MMTRKIPFFEYPRLWTDNKQEYISIFDSVASSGGFILQKDLADFETELAKYTGVIIPWVLEMQLMQWKFF